jgi:oligopeptide/dipeptide ABC transporter ATP-binding protein
LPEIVGMVPHLDQLPSGCRFADRCAQVQSRCRDEMPALQPTAHHRSVRCFYPVADAA